MTEPQSMPANKTELLDDLHAHWNAFLISVDSLPPEQWAGPADAAGWTAGDHVAHVTAWDRAVIGLFRDRTPQQRTLQVSDAAWAAGIDNINEEIRDRTGTQPVGALKRQRDATFVDLAAAIENLSDDDLERPAGEFGLDEGETCLREVLVAYLGHHYDEHRQYIVTFVQGEPKHIP